MVPCLSPRILWSNTEKHMAIPSLAAPSFWLLRLLESVELKLFLFPLPHVFLVLFCVYFSSFSCFLIISFSINHQRAITSWSWSLGLFLHVFPCGSLVFRHHFPKLMCLSLFWLQVPEHFWELITKDMWRLRYPKLQEGTYREFPATNSHWL